VKWLRSTLTDEEGRYDVAYVSLFLVAISTLSAVPFICVVSLISYLRCVPQAVKDLPVVTCNYDPQPVGFAIGAIAGGFATALGALAAYMAATRNRP